MLPCQSKKANRGKIQFGRAEERHGGSLVVAAAGPLEEGPAVSQAAGVCWQVLRSQLEVAEPFARLDVEDVEDKLQSVSGVGGLHAAECHQVLLAWAELYKLHLRTSQAFKDLEKLLME